MVPFTQRCAYGFRSVELGGWFGSDAGIQVRWSTERHSGEWGAVRGCGQGHLPGGVILIGTFTITIALHLFRVAYNKCIKAVDVSMCAQVWRGGRHVQEDVCRDCHDTVYLFLEEVCFGAFFLEDSIFSCTNTEMRRSTSVRNVWGI